MKFWLTIIFFVFLVSCKDNKSGLNIIFTGDVNLDRGVKDQIKLYGDSLLFNSFNEFNKKDFSIINFEGTFATNTANKQSDLYNFKADKHYISILKKSGVSHISIANNHVFDYGKPGYLETIKAIKKHDLIPLGDSCQPKLIQKGNNKCFVLSVSLTIFNDFLCIYSIDELKKSINNFKAKNKETPLIIYIHWGLELQPKPEKWQRELAKELISLGVDAIIGHHPHVTQTIEWIDNKPVFYSLGNFIADGYLQKTDKTYTVKINFSNKIEKVYINPYQIRKYFPKIIRPKEQLQAVQELLKYTKGICVFKTEYGWQIKSTKNINFKEKTRKWVFALNKKTIVIKKLSSGNHLLKVYNEDNSISRINIFGLLSQIQIADINNDNNIDIILAVRKKVHFDSKTKKRINIYTLKENRIKTLWLGTKFINDVERFHIVNHNNFNYLSILEKNNKGNKFRRIYKWDNFGFALTLLKSNDYEK